jgi:hydroxymethylbilane synthase
MLPQVGQGAIAVECRADDAGLRDRLAAISDPDAHRAVTAERAFLAELGGGCNLPCGALAIVDDAGTVTIQVLLASLDGRTVLRAHRRGDDPTAVGRDAARMLLDEHGGRALLAEAG